MGNSKAKPEQTNSKEKPTNQNEPSDPQLQIRNCIRNVRNNNGNFSEMYPDEAGTSCGQANRSSVYTIDVHSSNPTNFTNAGYVSTEGHPKANDGLPSYEEAISGIKSPDSNPNPNPIYPTLIPSAPMQPSVEVINEENTNGPSSRGRRHRHRRHRSNNHSHNENSQPDAPQEEHRRHRHRRGFRLKRQLAKINRRNNAETD